MEVSYASLQEHSLENLQFVVWYQDYRKRFFEMPEEEQARSPGPTDFKLSFPSRASIERRAEESLRRHAEPTPSTSQIPNPGTPLPTTSFSHSLSGLPAPEPAVTTPSSPSFPFSPAPSYPLPSSPGVSSPLSSNPPTFPKSLPDSANQPHRQECMRIITTFLRPGAIKEIPLDQIVRETVIRNLAHNTHPDVFLPAYEEMYSMLETTSLPRFIVHSSTHINRPKQYFWYAIGFTDLFLAILIALSIITMVRVPPQGRRAYRILSIPLAWLGATQIYSAWRGFCSVVWRRGNVQLRVWELQEEDEESHTYTAQLAAQSSHLNTQSPTHEPKPPPLPLGQLHNSPSGTRIDHPKSLYALDSQNGSVGSGLYYYSDDDEVRRRSGGMPPMSLLDFPPPLKTPRSKVRNGFMRPPVFGPERVVLDPHIKAVHEQVMGDIYRFGHWFALFFAAIVLSVPSRIR